MKRTIEMALSELVETDKELKKFEGPAYRALALQVAHYLGLNTDLVTKGENSSAICIGRIVAMFRPIEGTEHIQVELVGPLYNLEGITFTYKKSNDVYPLVSMIAKAIGVMGITELQLLRRISELMSIANIDVTFTYGQVSKDSSVGQVGENNYGIIMEVEDPDIKSVKASFYLQAISQDLVIIATCKAASDIYDGMETKSENPARVVKEICDYVLETFKQILDLACRNSA